MAHELEIVDGQAQMAYAGEVPWHGLGVPVSNDLSPCLLYTSPSPRDRQKSRMPSSA